MDISSEKQIKKDKINWLLDVFHLFLEKTNSFECFW